MQARDLHNSLLDLAKILQHIFCYYSTGFFFVHHGLRMVFINRRIHIRLKLSRLTLWEIRQFLFLPQSEGYGRTLETCCNPQISKLTTVWRWVGLSVWVIRHCSSVTNIPTKIDHRVNALGVELIKVTTWLIKVDFVKQSWTMKTLLLKWWCKQKKWKTVIIRQLESYLSLIQQSWIHFYKFDSGRFPI